MKARVRILVGHIASGKTGYARALAAQGWVIVCDDAVVEAVHAGVYTLYDKALKPLYKSTESHIAMTALAMGRPVAVDRGVNLRRDSRQRWLGMARSFDVPCEAVVFDMASPEEHARRRAASDPRGLSEEYWLRVASRHAEEYEPPALAEGFSSIIRAGDAP